MKKIISLIAIICSLGTKAQSLQKVKDEFVLFVKEYQSNFTLEMADLNDFSIVYNIKSNDPNDYLRYVLNFDKDYQITYKAVLMLGDNDNRIPLSKAFGNKEGIKNLFNGALGHFKLIRNMHPKMSCQYILINTDVTDITFPYIKLSDAPYGCVLYYNDLNNFLDIKSSANCWNY